MDDLETKIPDDPYKKLLFVYPTSVPSYPLQLGALSAYVKQFGFDTRLIPLIAGRGLTPAHFQKLKEEMELYKPKYAAFSAYETAFSWIKQLAKFIKENWPETIVIVGGYLATLSPEDVINEPNIDIICRGEGELALKELMETRGEDTTVKNMWFKRNGEIIRNPIRPLLENLDELPFPDREMLDYQEVINAEEPGQRNLKVMATRGCLYDCSYCVNRHMRALYPNKNIYYRVRSPESVIAELKGLSEKYQFDYIGFHDDNITINLDWLREFLTSYEKEIHKPFYCATRVERCTNEVLDMLKKAGCFLILMGVESGDEAYRKDMLKRYMSNDTLIDTFKRIRERGMMTWSFAMIGMPNETREMLWKTIKLNWQCQPDFVMSSIFYPFRGTQLGELCYKNNWVNLEARERVDNISWDSILNHPILSQNEIKFAKYLNSLTAIRSPFFWKAVVGRVHNYLIR